MGVETMSGKAYANKVIKKPEHDSCDGCKHYLGAGCCRQNLEAECCEGGGFEMWEE